MSVPTALNRLKHGDRAVITAIESTPVAVARLAARGIVPGVQVGVLAAGDPLLIGVDNDRWALDRTEAEAILVTPTPRNRGRLATLFRRR